MRLVFVGGGGHCRSCIDAAERAQIEIAGVVDPDAGADVLGYPVLGDDTWIDAHVSDGEFAFLVSVGTTGSAAVRRRIFEHLRRSNATIATLVSATAVVSRHACVEEGTVVLERAIVNANARVGANCIINTAALIEHDARIGDHTHVSTGALINGNVVIGQGCMIGSGAVIRHGVRIADGVVVGAGATVIADIDAAGTWVGTPARRMK